jgi:hypothetical protein
MHVDAAILCQRVSFENRLATLEGVGIDTFIIDQLGDTFTAPVFVRVVGPHDTNEHDLLVQVRDANGEMQTEAIQPLTFKGRPADSPEGWDSRAMTVVSLSWTVQAAGTFELIVSIDGSAPISQPIFIRGPNQ